MMNNKTLMGLMVACLLSGAGFASPGLAQPQPAATAKPQTSAVSPDKTGNKRERIKNKIRSMRAYFLTEELELDSKMAGKFFPILETYDQQFDALRVARSLLRVKLESLTDSKEIDKTIDAVVLNQKALWDLESARFAALRGVITSKQMAKLVLMLPTLENQIGKRLERAAKSIETDEVLETIRERRGNRRGSRKDD
jgi:hypothetical protein